MMGYPCQTPQNAMDVAQELISDSTLVKIQNESGGAL